MARGNQTRRPASRYFLKCIRVDQWQAQEAPQPPAGEASVEAAVAVSPAADSVPEVAVEAGLDVAPPLKSVAYQPDPLSWKPAAVSCLLNVALPQAGQSVSGASEIFCRTSLAWPQDPHL
jgi:hypothetical protein